MHAAVDSRCNENVHEMRTSKIRPCLVATEDIDLTRNDQLIHRDVVKAMKSVRHAAGTAKARLLGRKAKRVVNLTRSDGNNVDLLQRIAKTQSEASLDVGIKCSYD